MTDQTATARRVVAAFDASLSTDQRVRLVENEPLPRNVGALLDEAAEATPAHVAWYFVADDDAISYHDLRERVNRVANGLSAAGVRAGTHVAVMLPNIAAMPLTWLALARLGAVMIPINSRFTGRELHYALDDGDADFLIIHESTLETLAAMPSAIPALRDRVYVVGPGRGTYRDWEDLWKGQSAALAVADEPSLDTVLNLQYTSGTTGFPKGCILTHRYWLTCAKAYGYFDGVAYERLFADNPFFYMTPQWLLLMAFFHRATLYVAPWMSASRFADSVRTLGINYCLFREMYYRHPPSTLDAENALVRMNIYSHRGDSHADMEQRYNCAIRSAFGMTEIGVGLIMPIEASDMVGSGSCGIPAPFRECRIADEQGNSLPVGAVGELLVRGPGMLQGYYGKPEATAAAFHGEWFRTGDMAHCDARGYYYIVGRIKDMVRRSGENIAANEVESVIEMLPQIAEAAVLGVPDDLRGEEVKAYVVLVEGNTAEQVPPQLLLEHCARNLAVFKVPRFIEYRGAPLPRTASGKISKPRLLEERADVPAPMWDRVEQRWRQPE